MKETIELPLLKDKDAALEMSVRAVRHYMEKCGLVNHEERLRWLSRLFDRLIDAELMVH